MTDGWESEDEALEEETRAHRRHFEQLVKDELHDIFARMIRMENKMADFETALADLVGQVKAVGERVTADITALKDEIAAMGVATTARFQAAADSIEAQAAELAKVDVTAPVIPAVSNTPGTPPAVSGTTTDVTPVPTPTPADTTTPAAGAGPATDQSPTATPPPTP